jgi:hypothetical protein
MSTLYRAADCRTANGLAPAGADAGHIGDASMYLTDEVFLYRVVGAVASAVDEIVELEDCYLLDVVPVAVQDLRARRLRLVTPAQVRR